MNYKKYIPLGKLLLVITLFFYASFFQIIPIKLYGINYYDVLNSEYIKYGLQIFSSLCLAIILFMTYRKSIIEDFKKFKENIGQITDIAFKYWIIGLVVMAISNVLINYFSPNNIASNEQSIQLAIETAPILAFFLTTIFAPFNEEIIFRKSLKTVIEHKWLFIILSGLFFGSLHVISSLDNFYDLLYIIPYSALGISFAYIYHKTDNIFSTIFVHLLHNGVLTILSIVGGMMML